MSNLDLSGYVDPVPEEIIIDYDTLAAHSGHKLGVTEFNGILRLVCNEHTCLGTIVVWERG